MRFSKFQGVKTVFWLVFLDLRLFFQKTPPIRFAPRPIFMPLYFPLQNENLIRGVLQ